MIVIGNDVRLWTSQNLFPIKNKNKKAPRLFVFRLNRDLQVLKKNEARDMCLTVCDNVKANVNIVWANLNLCGHIWVIYWHTFPAHIFVGRSIFSAHCVAVFLAGETFVCGYLYIGSGLAPPTNLRFSGWHQKLVEVYCVSLVLCVTDRVWWLRGNEPKCSHLPDRGSRLCRGRCSSQNIHNVSIFFDL